MYKLTIDPKIVQRLSDGVWIPADENNSDYKTYLRWLDGYEYKMTGIMKMEWVKTSDGNLPLSPDEDNT